MNTINPQSTVANKTRSVSSSFMERVNALRTKLALAFRSAVESYQTTLDAENRIAKIEKDLAWTPPRAENRLRLTGYLIELDTQKTVPLFEGIQYYTVSKLGQLERLEKCDPVNNPFDYGLEIRLGKAVIEEGGQNIKPQEFETNETLYLGGRGYLLKLLPDKYRRTFETGGSVGEPNES